MHLCIYLQAKEVAAQKRSEKEKAQQKMESQVQVVAIHSVLAGEKV